MVNERQHQRIIRDLKVFDDLVIDWASDYHNSIDDEGWELAVDPTEAENALLDLSGYLRDTIGALSPNRARNRR